jgi:hypothetical protein
MVKLDFCEKEIFIHEIFEEQKLNESFFFIY